MKLSRKGWNNTLIISIIVFIGVIQLPQVIRQHLSSSEPDFALLYLLPESTPLNQIHFADFSLDKRSGIWISDQPLHVEADELLLRWTSLMGTPVDLDTMTLLRPQLPLPNTIEAWFDDVEEPARLTIYQMPQFWLMQNWQGEWLAVSVDKDYLFPLKS